MMDFYSMLIMFMLFVFAVFVVGIVMLAIYQLANKILHAKNNYTYLEEKRKWKN